MFSQRGKFYFSWRAGIPINKFFRLIVAQKNNDSRGKMKIVLKNNLSHVKSRTLKKYYFVLNEGGRKNVKSKSQKLDCK